MTETISKETLLKLTLVSSRPFHGHTGRTYKMALGDLSGSLNAFVTRKRFYAIISLNTKKDAALDEKFLSSFELPERLAGQQPDDPVANALNVIAWSGYGGAMEAVPLARRNAARWPGSCRH